MIRTVKPVDEYYIQQLRESEQGVLVSATKRESMELPENKRKKIGREKDKISVKL